jgi:NADH-quinone oxidoreductase subunit J
MDVKTGLFYLFAAVLLFAAFRVITARNPVYAALYLVLAFFQASAIWLLLRAEFLAISLVLVYVGAVMVLFLFVVMMLDINVDGLREGFWKHFPLAAGVGALIALEMAAVLMGGFRLGEAPRAASGPMAANASNTLELGKLLYTEYLYPLEIAAVILLVAIVAAIALTLRTRKDSKYVNPADQVRVKARDRVRIVQMPARARPNPWPKHQPRMLQRKTRHDAHARTLSFARRDALRAVGDRHLPEPQEPDRAADGHRADAAGGQHELRGVLPLPGRHARTDLRVLHPDGGRGRVGHRAGAAGSAVPQQVEHQRGRTQLAQGLKAT